MLNKQRGFISSQFAKIITDAPAAEPEEKDLFTEKTADTVRVEITAYSLNIRSSPDTDSEVIGKLIKGQEVNAAVHDDDWLVVLTWDNRQGFISSQFAKTVTDAPPAEPAKEETAGVLLVEITADSLNIRSAPSPDSEVVGKFFKGRKIFSFVHDKDWFKVLTESNQKGYISSQYTRIITDFSADTLTPHIATQEGVLCDEDTAGLSLTIEDVSFHCKWDYFGNESKGCATEFDVSINAQCDTDINVYVDCEADISYDTKYGYFPSRSREYGYDKVSVSSGQGTSSIVLNWNARSYFDPVVRAKLKDGSCKIGKVFSYYK
jgi:hypothetical protein